MTEGMMLSCCRACSATNLTGETGTYVYMAPEMIRHELYTSKADVYSWGVMLAEILWQRPPYEGLYLTPVQVDIGSSGPCMTVGPGCSRRELAVPWHAVHLFMVTIVFLQWLTLFGGAPGGSGGGR
jgi:serine/threonine protein kinase